MEHETVIEYGGCGVVLVRNAGGEAYAVVRGKDGRTGIWAEEVAGYGFGGGSGVTAPEALAMALDRLLCLLDGARVPYARLRVISEDLKDGLVQDGEAEAYEYMADTVKLSPAEASFLGLDMDRYAAAREEA